MALNDLLKKPLQFIMFGGKGGVGKTTMAAAASLRFAEEYSKRHGEEKNKVLIFTTDPAPSLADSFGQEIGNEPTAIKGAKNLFAMEIDAKKILEEFKEEYGEDILDILRQGTYLEDKEAEEMFTLDIPGLDEVMGLKKIMDFMENEEYRLYIVDTAPTGHTLRLLTLPELLDNWIKFLASLRWKYHYIVERASGRKRIESADKFLLEMKKTVKKVRSILQDPAKTEFVVVTIAEAMGVAETEDLISILEKSRIPSRHIIINNIFPSENSSFARMKRKNQEKYINEIKKKFSDYTITEVILQPNEVQGVDSLKNLGKRLFH
ncbi:ArsA family ATPase [Patescibacteria group bacterium]|nr:ArsA family ATPase [Patescibacteria group bacterium]MBU4369084.1 ArsA family ATPase [Patescibacteria group bacterium]